MSHLVYMTLFGETDGVTLSRLDCTLNMMISIVTNSNCLCSVLVVNRVVVSLHVIPTLFVIPWNFFGGL